MVSYNRKVAHIDASILVQVCGHFLYDRCIEGIYRTAQRCCRTVHLRLRRALVVLNLCRRFDGCSESILGFLRILTWQCSHYSSVIQVLRIRNCGCECSLVYNRLVNIADRYALAGKCSLNDGSLRSHTELGLGNRNRSGRIPYIRLCLEG
ncbi:hypothetical protein D3C72_1746160 [compost metagenome]